MPKPTFLLTCWKPYEAPEKVHSFIKELELQFSEGIIYGIALPFSFLKAIGSKNPPSQIALGSFSTVRDAKGSFTSDVFFRLLKGAGGSFALIGSNEQRLALGLDDRSVSLQMKEALKAGIMPVLCVGETSQEYQEGLGGSVVERQLTHGLEGLSKEDLKGIGIFFESPWINQLLFLPTSEEIKGCHERDLALLEKVIGAENALNVRVIHTIPHDVEASSLDLKGSFFGNKDHLPHLAEKIKEFASLQKTEKDAFLEEKAVEVNQEEPVVEPPKKELLSAKNIEETIEKSVLVGNDENVESLAEQKEEEGEKSAEEPIKESALAESDSELESRLLQKEEGTSAKSAEETIEESVLAESDSELESLLLQKEEGTSAKSAEETIEKSALAESEKNLPLQKKEAPSTKKFEAKVRFSSKGSQKETADLSREEKPVGGAPPENREKPRKEHTISNIS